MAQGSGETQRREKLRRILKLSETAEWEIETANPTEDIMPQPAEEVGNWWENDLKKTEADGTQK